MHWEDVLSELRRANLPTSDYVVVGGAALTARGIRETEDIDLVVTTDLFQDLGTKGWCRKQRPNGKPGLKLGRIEAYLDVDCGVVQRSTDFLLKQAEPIDGVRIIDLSTLASFKASYGRPKDIRDLALIEQHLTNSAERHPE